MAQTARAPKAFIFTSKSSQATDIAALRTAIQAGKKIYKDDINKIVTLVNNMLGHYHTYEDYIQAATYGVGYGQTPGAGDRTLYTGDKNTSRPTNFPADLGAIPTGAVVISAAAINVGLTALRAMGSHSHSIQDTTAR